MCGTETHASFVERPRRRDASSWCGNRHPLYPDHKFKADPIIGSWLKGRDRSKVILSTKVTPVTPTRFADRSVRVPSLLPGLHRAFWSSCLLV